MQHPSYRGTDRSFVPALERSEPAAILPLRSGGNDAIGGCLHARRLVLDAHHRALMMVRDIAVDLGTANTVVTVVGRGVVLDEATVIALEERTGDVVAIGHEAFIRAGLSQGVTAIRPVRRGAITDFELTERLLRLVLGRVGTGRFVHPRAIVAVSSALTTVEQRAVREAVTSAGARSAVLIEEPIAAAIGVGMPIEQPFGNCIIDIGGGTTEAAVIAMGGIVARTAAPVGGFDLDEAIRCLLRDEHGVTVTDRMAEEIKRTVGSAAPLPDEPKAEITGRELSSGAPRTVIVSAEEIRAALETVVGRIIDAVRAVLAATPPDLAHDVLERGMVLTGGSALLQGLDRRLQTETGIPVQVPERPLYTVCEGAARALHSFDRLKHHGIFMRV